MKVRFGKYGIAFYTNRFVHVDAGATTYYCFAFIRPKYLANNDEGICQHEMLHTRQWWRCILSFGSKCLSHLVMEVDAYKLQLEYYPATENRLKYELLYSSFLAHRYEFSDQLTQEEALKLLRS